jgi:hypothetical protein
MYCPGCGIQNNDETKFCRGCGENLRDISQAMSRRLPAFLVRRLDAHIERRNREVRRESIGGAVMGSLFIFLGLYDVIGTGASWANEWFHLAFGCFMLFMGLWDHMVYKRSLATEVRVVKMGGPAATDELPALDGAQIVEPLASITESTTQHLDATIERQEKS